MCSRREQISPVPFLVCSHPCATFQQSFFDGTSDGAMNHLSSRVTPSEWKEVIIGHANFVADRQIADCH